MLVDRFGVAGGWDVKGVIVGQVVSVERVAIAGGWGGEVLDVEGVIERGGVVVGSLAGGSGSDWSLVGEG